MPVVERVTPEDALERVRTVLGARGRDLALNFDQVDFHCEPGELREVMKSLRDTEGLRCEFFTFLSAIDRSEFGGPDKADKHGGLELLVHVYSPDHVIHVNVHVPLDTENPVCPSISDIYLGAIWHERETHEMFGIDFDGHPRLVNLYLPEDFDGHPLRRSFKLPSRAVKEWPGAKDPEEAAAGGR
ncbi:MAG TPA: NADH-quinone oxidoreductase subunit C [Actinomycetota bacterium]|nr:NADH-quinone oxidoreductase subunit C [Actinomycetota bacterium]